MYVHVLVITGFYILLRWLYKFLAELAIYSVEGVLPSRKSHNSYELFSRVYRKLLSNQDEVVHLMFNCLLHNKLIQDIFQK